MYRNFVYGENKQIVDELQMIEPTAMQSQMPVAWNYAKGSHIFDCNNDKWIDLTSGVLVANIGHSHPRVVQAIIEQAEKSLLHNYIFPSEERVKLIKKLLHLLPKYQKVLLLTTGSEAIEALLKLTRSYWNKRGEHSKKYIISFVNGFHGRTMGAQKVGGLEKQKYWISKTERVDFIQVPYPDDETYFSSFTQSLREKGITDSEVALVLIEGYQGSSMKIMNKQYAQNLERWCRQNNVIYAFDEIQSGFGRTGKLFSFQHFDVTPDVIICSKGITSSLPLSAVIGEKQFMDSCNHGEISSTHTGNPLSIAAAIATIEAIEEEGIIEKSNETGYLFNKTLKEIKNRYPQLIKNHTGIGMVAGLHMLSSKLAYELVNYCADHRILLFTPVGSEKNIVKISPPLTIYWKDLKKALDVIQSFFERKE